jgi:hypothetical protein
VLLSLPARPHVLLVFVPTETLGSFAFVEIADYLGLPKPLTVFMESAIEESSVSVLAVSPLLYGEGSWNYLQTSQSTETVMLCSEQ